MLVSNSCANDTRVIRAAETVAQQGFDTVVLALSDDGNTSEETRNGVLYRRIGRPWFDMKLRAPPAKNPALRKVFRASSNLAARILLAAEFLGRAFSLRPAPLAQIRLALSAGQSLLDYVASRFFGLRPLVETRRMRRVFKSDLMKLQPDVIHAHDLVMLPAGAAAAESLGAKLIYDAHELEVHRNTKSGPIEKWLRYCLERKHIKQCDAVVTVCDSIADHLAREYAIARPTVVMNAPDVAAGLPSDTDLRSSLGLSSDTPLAVYVGRITVGCGIEQIVDALQYLPGYHIALVGPVNKPTVDQAEATAQALGIAGRLHIVSPISPAMVVSFISTGDISLVPIQNVCLSYYYCLPNKLLESAIARLPVVVSNLPELKRFVEISESGVVMDQTDPRDIARAIHDAYENRDRLRPDANRLRHTEEIYGWQRQKEALMALYSSFNLPTPACRVSSSSMARLSVAPSRDA